jgi:hypothetical protein
MATLAAERCKRKFLRFFPGGFEDESYLDWERSYNAEASDRWHTALSKSAHCELITAARAREMATEAVRIESRTNLLFSFEKMALRDATRSEPGACSFARGLYDFLYGGGSAEAQFTAWCQVVSTLPRRQTRVLTWPVVTVFGFIARPDLHMFLKPNVTRIAAARYGFDFEYQSRPAWRTYRSLLDFAELVRHDLEDLHPRDMIDVQSFIWVQGSDEYRGRAFKAARTTTVR